MTERRDPTKATQSAALINLGFGVSILLFGYKTPSLVILLSALKIAGYDEVKNSYNKLHATYERARVAINNSRPEIQSELAQILELEKELVDLAKKHASGAISTNILNEERTRITKDLQLLKNVTNKIGLTFRQIVSSTNLTDLEVCIYTIHMHVVWYDKV